jgi:hypothetical protein
LALAISVGPVIGRSNSRTALSAWKVVIWVVSPGCRRCSGTGLPKTAMLNGARTIRGFPVLNGGVPEASTIDDSPLRNSSWVG